MFIHITYVNIYYIYKHILHICIIIIRVYNILKMNDFFLNKTEAGHSPCGLPSQHKNWRYTGQGLHSVLELYIFFINMHLFDINWLAEAFIQSWNSCLTYFFCKCIFDIYCQTGRGLRTVLALHFFWQQLSRDAWDHTLLVVFILLECIMIIDICFGI